MSEKEEFEMPSAGMPKWINDHVELYLSDPGVDPTARSEMCVEFFIGRQSLHQSTSNAQ